MIEAWGQGIERIMGTCRLAGVPLPELQVEGSGLWVIFQYVNYSLPPQVTAEVATVEVTPKEHLLIALQGEMHRKDLQQALNIKHAEHFRLHYLLPALAAGLIEMTIPDKPNSRLQKYKLTTKGKMRLGKLLKKGNIKNMNYS